MNTSIWWIRRDLRIQHNPTLVEALDQADRLLPVFILDPNLLEKKADRRTGFLFSALESLDQELRKLGSRLLVVSGEPLETLRSLVKTTGARMIFAEDDFSPYARQRDLKVAGELLMCLVNGLTIFPPGVVVKNNGCPYTIFTPYKRAWLSMLLPVNPAADKRITALPPFPTGDFTSVQIPEYAPSPEFPANTAEADRRFDQFLNGAIFDYATLRDRMDVDGTSRLSPYLRFGLISVQQILPAALHLLQGIKDPARRKGPETWVSELIWREFYISILHHFPEVLKGSFRRDLRNIRWRNDPAELQAWQIGLTGYPVVDAAQRQLLATGWMHNRARMISASFLVKDLLVNWQTGESFFMERLIDGDPAANNGGWQWTAGVGTDAAPYFRIFNPVLQGEKFDPRGDYVRRWVPELAGVPEEWIHKPWLVPADLQRRLGVQIGKNYPAPIVDHATMRKQTLAAFNTGQPHDPLDACGCEE